MLHLLGMEVLGDWWWGGLVGQFLVARLAPAAAADGRADGPALGLAAGGLVRGGRLPDDPLDLPAGGHPLRRGAALLLPRRPGLGGRVGPGPTEPARGRGSGALVGLLAGGAMACKYPGPGLGGRPVRPGRPGRRRPAAVAGGSSLAFVAGLGGRRWPPGWPRTWSTRATRSIRWPTGSSAAGTGTPHATPSGRTPTGRGRSTRRPASGLDRRRRRPVRLAVAPVRRAGPAGLAAARARGGSAWRSGGYVGLPLPDLVALDPPARPLLAAAAARRWPILAGLGADWTRRPGLVDPARR